jgi:hypothetical protein
MKKIRANSKMVEKYDHMKEQIERIWLLAVFKFALSKLAPSFSNKVSDIKCKLIKLIKKILSPSI